VTRFQHAADIVIDRKSEVVQSPARHLFGADSQVQPVRMILLPLAPSGSRRTAYPRLVS
jgi:hypothetical protein